MNIVIKGNKKAITVSIIITICLIAVIRDIFYHEVVSAPIEESNEWKILKARDDFR